MTDFLTTLAEVSLTMAAVIALLLLLGPLLSKRWSPRWRYWAWLCVAVRLLIPFNFSLPQAPVQLKAPAANTVVYAPPKVQAPPVQPVQSSTPVTPPAPAPGVNQAIPNPAAPENTEAAGITLGQLLFGVWLGGALLTLGWHLVSHLRFKRYVRRWGEPVENDFVLELLDHERVDLGLRKPVELLTCPGLKGPMLAGVTRPAILMPKGASFAPAALRLILRHELCHLRRRDIPYKTLLLLCACFHWFNPLVWAMAHAAGRDIELCCDDAVSTGLSAGDRAEYGDAILKSLRTAKKA